MSTTIDQAFITQFEDEVKLAYQQMGSKLRNTCRLKPGARGEKVRFQTLGKGIAGQKSRHGNVPVMNATHAYVDATLEDWYGADYVDNMDELKTNIDERMIQAQTAAAALGRKADSLIISALESVAGTTVATAATGLTKAKILSAFETLNGYDVPDDGQRFCIVGPHQWNELLNLSEFKSADYVGAGDLPWTKGTEVKRWMNIYWMMHTGLTLSSGDRKCLMYHRTGIGLAEALNISTEIAWVTEKDAHLVKAKMSMGSIGIDDEGVVEIDCDDDAAIS